MTLNIALNKAPKNKILDHPCRAQDWLEWRARECRASKRGPPP